MESFGSDYQLTDEQLSVIRSTARKTRIIAYAGAAKTTCLIEFAKARPESRFLNLAYNRAIRDENKEKFGSNTSVLTTHQLAFGAVGRKYQSRLGNLNFLDVKELLGTQNWNHVRDSLNTLKAFFYSADDEIELHHFEDATIPSLSSKAVRYNKYVLHLAQRLWDAQDDVSGTCKVEHDFYLKKFFLTSAYLVGQRYDYILVDEFQDTNPALLDFIKKCDTPIVVVEDPYQQIYRWRGAVDAGEDQYFKSTDTETYRLTKSFRFGKNIACVANDMLTLLGEPVPLEGYKENDTVASQIEPHVDPQMRTITYLHRTVIGTIDTALDMAEKKRKTHWVGGIDKYDIPNIKDVCYLSLSQPDKIRNKKLKSSFRDFASYKEYAKATGDPEAGRCVQLIKKHGDAALLIKLGDLGRWAVTNEFQALSVVSTIHRSKGLEWDWVVLADMTEFEKLMIEKENPEQDWLDIKDELHLFYVASTRAMEGLVVDINTKMLRSTAESVRNNDTKLKLPVGWANALGIELVCTNTNTNTNTNTVIDCTTQTDSGVKASVDLTSTQNCSYLMFKRGACAEEIATLRSLDEDTVLIHLSVAIEKGLLSFNDVISLSEKEYVRVSAVLKECDYEKTRDLKAVCDELDGYWLYGEIMCAVASQQIVSGGLDYDAYCRLNNVDYYSLPSHKISYHLFCDGVSVQEIASERSLKEETIYGHLSSAIRDELLDLDTVVGLDEAQIDSIVSASDALNTEHTRILKPIYNEFEGRYLYGEIKCVLASRRPKIYTLLR